ncbi:unnamed protein product [Amaranthus hypochondriacus]
MAEISNTQNQNQSNNQIKLISESYIRPKYEVEAAKKPYYLTPLEICSLVIDPIQKGLLFSLNNSTKKINELLKNLENSLSITLVHFYPLAGRFVTKKFPDENSSLIYLDCIKGPGARLIHATALHLTVSDFFSSTDVPIFVRSFFDLGEITVNYDGHTKALLSIQVTELQDGLFIGFSMNHGVVDGTSFTHFISMLSEIFNRTENNTSISRGPIFNYNPFKKFDLGTIIKVPCLEPEKLIEYGFEPGPLRERIFHFSRTILTDLKIKANQQCGTHNKISSFQALAALVWRSITRARKIKPDELTACSIVINMRSRFDPPICDDYFGTFVINTTFVCSVEELLGHDLGWAAMGLHKAIIAKDEEAMFSDIKFISQSPLIFSRHDIVKHHGPNNVIIGGSARFDMYGPEFGFGRALAVRMGYPNNKGDGKVTANPGCEGGGSVDLEICLRPDFMANFEADPEFMSFVSL